MGGITNIKRCGNCHFGHFMPEDFSRRVCWGAPPSVYVVPAGEGQRKLQMLRPVVFAADDACALYRSRGDEEVTDVVQRAQAETKQ